MKTRVISGVIIVVFLIAVFALNGVFPPILNIAAAFISLMSVHELISAVGLGKKYMLLIPSIIFAVAVPFAGMLGIDKFVLSGIYVLSLFVGIIFAYKQISFKDLAMVCSMTLIMPNALSCIVSARDLSPEFGLFYAVIAVLTAWIPDTGAYFVGTLFGKHKLCPEISPKKTVEGFVGGIVCNGIIMMLLGLVWNLVFFGGAAKLNIVAILIIGLGGAVISVIGDLSFSIIKRNENIKDFGKLIPGHGGILDRFDSVIFTAPYVYIILSLLPAFAA